MNMEEPKYKVVDEFFSPSYDCEYTNEIVCPHCGHKHSDSWEMEPKDEECTTTNCDSCGKSFSLCVQRSTTYTTRCGESYKDCDLVSQPSKEHPDYLVCSRCGNVNFGRFLKN